MAEVQSTILVSVVTSSGGSGSSHAVLSGRSKGRRLLPEQRIKAAGDYASDVMEALAGRLQKRTTMTTSITRHERGSRSTSSPRRPQIDSRDGKPICEIALVCQFSDSERDQAQEKELAAVRASGIHVQMQSRKKHA